MQRPIKFRAWDVTDEKMFEPDGFTFEMGLSSIKVKEVGLLVNPNEMSNTYKVMQYTGFKDKNGVEIYEEDILRWPDQGEFSFDAVVRYQGWEFCLDLFQTGEGMGFEDFETERELEVIGNIYENPELINADTN